MALASAFPIAIVSGMLLAIVVPNTLGTLLGRGSPWLSMETPQGRIFWCVYALTVICGVTTISLIPYIGLLRFAVARRVRNASCPQCAYVLFGLAISDDKVLCPECGRTTSLSRHGLRPDDITIGISARTPQPPEVSRWRCKRVVISLCVCVPVTISMGSVWIVTGERRWFELALLSFMISLLVVVHLLDPDFLSRLFDNDDEDLDNGDPEREQNDPQNP